jgi:hypothetical protein
MDNEVVVIWDSVKVDKPEFRLYYDDKGYVITYTCEQPEGNYIVVDAMTFAEARPDIRVVDGKIVKNNVGSVVSRLYKDTEGVLCEAEDISIIAETNGQYWKLVTINIA